MMRGFMLLSLFLSFTASAGIEGKLLNMFNKMGFSGHANAGKAYLDQSGGYVTGGSLFARAPVEDHRLMSFQAPSFGFGCGGIDLFTGGMSFISKEDLVNSLRAIGSNAMSYAYGLALQQVTPQIKAVIDNLQAAMQEINNANINSCRMAAQLVGGLAPKTQASSELYCSSKGLKMGAFSDYADAKHQCQKPDKRSTVRSNGDAEFKDQLGEEFNLVWKAIQGNGFLAEDQQTAEFMMSISGSIISKVEGDSPKTKYLPSLATNPQFIKAIIGAGLGATQTNTRLKLYKCDEGTKCLNPFTTQEIDIGKDKTLIHRVNEMVLDLYERITTDTAPTAEQKGFINATSIPILRILSINAAYKNDSDPIAIPELVEIIAYDILLRHMERILEMVLENVIQLKQVQISGTEVKEFRANLSKTHGMIIKERRTLLHQIQSTMAIVERTRKLEQYAYNKFIGNHIEDD